MSPAGRFVRNAAGHDPAPGSLRTSTTKYTVPSFPAAPSANDRARAGLSDPHRRAAIHGVRWSEKGKLPAKKEPCHVDKAHTGWYNRPAAGNLPPNQAPVILAIRAVGASWFGVALGWERARGRLGGAGRIEGCR